MIWGRQIEIRGSDERHVTLTLFWLVDRWNIGVRSSRLSYVRSAFDGRSDTR